MMGEIGGVQLIRGISQEGRRFTGTDHAYQIIFQFIRSADRRFTPVLHRKPIA